MYKGAEIDRKAIRNAIYNCKLNNIEIPFIDVNKIIIQEKFDILMANILSETLIQLSSTFKILTRKKLILSGILDTQVRSVIDSYSDWITLKSKKNLEGWNLLEGNL
jgi:Ribosomal protein L11 methylase